jgi:hypothetical protein
MSGKFIGAPGAGKEAAFILPAFEVEHIRAFEREFSKDHAG